MIYLQDEFRNNQYTDLLLEYAPGRQEEFASEYGFYLEDLFDPDKKPSELLGIFISDRRDDLFLLLNGDALEPDALCTKWDNRIRTFTIMNGRSEAVKKLKYNIVQLIVYSGAKPDRRQEGNLQMSRKIILEGDPKDPTRVLIKEEDVIELPFHMIPPGSFSVDPVLQQSLRELLPKNDDLFRSMTEEKKKVNKTNNGGVLTKSLNTEEYRKIKEWLEHDHS